MYPTASCHRERESDIKTGHCSPTHTTSIHHRMTKTARIPRHIEKEEKPGTRQFGEALRDPEVPQWPTRQLHQMRGVVRGKGEAGPGISRTQLDLPGWSILGAPGRGPLPTLLVPALLRPVGYSQEELLASRGNAFYFQLRNSHHHLGSC